MDNFLNDDFNDFSSSEGFKTPKAIDDKIITFVRKDLNPDHKTVFLKLLFIQGFVGTLTLLFCPQFELSLTNNYEIYHYFHHTFGVYGCYMICGFLFIGAGSIFASYILKSSEIKKIKSNRILYYLAISMIAILVFLFLGAEIYFLAALTWAAGAILGGIIVLEVNAHLRPHLFYY